MVKITLPNIQSHTSLDSAAEVVEATGPTGALSADGQRAGRTGDLPTARPAQSARSAPSRRPSRATRRKPLRRRSAQAEPDLAAAPTDVEYGSVAAHRSIA